MIKQSHLIQKGDKLLVGVSGGQDSMTLLDVLLKANYSLHVAHVNYGLRSTDSQLDEELVVGFCEVRKVPCHVYKVSGLDWDSLDGSIQMKARKIRFKYFKTVMKANGLNKLVLAHHAEDQAETILMHLMRGSGINGLKGMSMKARNIIRPLLLTSKDEITEYALAHQIPWREDESNQSNKYRRNRLRNEVFPILKSMIPTVSKSIAFSGSHLEADAFFMKMGIQYLKKHVSTPTDEGIVIDIPKIKIMPFGKDMLYHLLQPFGFSGSDVGDIWKCLSKTGAVKPTGVFTAIIDRKKIIVQRQEIDPTFHLEINLLQGNMRLPDGRVLTWRKISPSDPLEYPKSQHHIWLDYHKVLWPLTLRTWQEGDVFVPFGMKGRQKVSDLLINQKVSIFDKAKTLVLCSGSDILWVVGHRLASKGAIDTTTTEIIEIICS